MLSNWQITILDNAIWVLPILVVGALAVFPWKHWNAFLDSLEGTDESG